MRDGAAIRGQAATLCMRLNKEQCMLDYAGDPASSLQQKHKFLMDLKTCKRPPLSLVSFGL